MWYNRLPVLFFAMTVSVSAADLNLAETPRQKYIKEFDFRWDVKSHRKFTRLDAPFFGRYKFYVPYQYYECGLDYDVDSNCDVSIEFESLKDSYFYHAERFPNFAPGEPWFSIAPFSLKELARSDVDWAVIPICSGAFNTLEDNAVFLTDWDNEYYMLEREIELTIAEKKFTDQFLSSIGASKKTKIGIKRVGILTTEANEILREAWISGELKRPAVVIGLGECGAGEVSVGFRYRAPTKRAQIVTEFDYRICEFLGVEPFDDEKCPHTRDIVSETELLSGAYRIRLERENGKIEFRKIDIQGESNVVL